MVIAGTIVADQATARECALRSYTGSHLHMFRRAMVQLWRSRHEDQVPVCMSFNSFEQEADNHRVRASDSTIQHYESWINSCEESLEHHTSSAVTKTKEINYPRHLLHSCTNPTSSLNQDTLDEIAALDILGSGNCKHAPWLLAVGASIVHPGTHGDATPGG